MKARKTTVFRIFPQLTTVPADVKYRAPFPAAYGVFHLYALLFLFFLYLKYSDRTAGEIFADIMSAVNK